MLLQAAMTEGRGLPARAQHLDTREADDLLADHL